MLGYIKHKRWQVSYKQGCEDATEREICASARTFYGAWSVENLNL